MSNGDQLTTDDLPDDGISRYVYGQEGTASEGGIWFQDASGTLHELGAPTGPAADPISMLDEETVASWEAQGYTPVWNGQTGRWEPVAPKMPQSWQQEALSALMAGDEDKAQNIWKFFNQMSQGDKVDLALRLTTTPGDYMTYWSLLRQRQQARGYNPGERIIPLPEFLTSTIGQSLGLDTGTAPGTVGGDGTATGGRIHEDSDVKNQGYEWGQHTPADMTAFEEGTRGTAPVTPADMEAARRQLENELEIKRREGMGPIPGFYTEPGTTGGPLQTGGTRLPGEYPSLQGPIPTEYLPMRLGQPGPTGIGDHQIGGGGSQQIVPNMGATRGPTYTNPWSQGHPFSVQYDRTPYTAAARPMSEAEYVTNTPAPAIEYPPHLTPDTGGPRPEFPNRTPPVPALAQVPYSPELGGMKGYAKGGIVGLHGPEVALLGEYGPEYVVPMFKGQPLGLQTLGPSYDATGPIPRTPAFGYAAQVSKPRIISTLGAPTIPSAQGWGRMGPVERSQFQKSVEFGGFAWPEYMNQMQRLMPKFPTRGRKPTMIPRFV